MRHLGERCVEVFDPSREQRGRIRGLSLGPADSASLGQEPRVAGEALEAAPEELFDRGEVQEFGRRVGAERAPDQTRPREVDEVLQPARREVSEERAQPLPLGRVPSCVRGRPAQARQVQLQDRPGLTLRAASGARGEHGLGVGVATGEGEERFVLEGGIEARGSLAERQEGGARLDMLISAGSEVEPEQLGLGGEANHPRILEPGL